MKKYFILLMKLIRVLKFAVPATLLTMIAGAIIIYPERYISSCLQGFAMWAECVLPSLFPFMVITLIMIKSGFAEKASLPLKKVTGLFNLPPAAAVCFIISICSGYPAGSKCVLEFFENGSISAKDAKKLSALCSTSGPLFIIGSVGVKMLGDKSAGWKILLAHFLSVLIITLIISFFSKKDGDADLKRAPVKGNLLYDSFYGAVVSVAVAGGFIAFFAVTAQILSDFNFLIAFEKLFALFTDERSAKAVSLGLVEVTVGCRTLSAAGGSLSVPLAGFLITFGGASILMQQFAYFGKAGVPPLYFVGVKLAQATACFLLLLLICA